MPIVRVQFIAANNVGTATTISATLGSTPTDANALIAVIMTSGTTASRVSSITQTGASWARVVQQAGANGSIELWAAYNIASAATGVTVNLAASLQGACVITEYSGLLLTGTLDQTASATDTYPVGAQTGTTAPTTQGKQLWIGGLGDSILSSWANPTDSFTEVSESASTSLVSMVFEERFAGNVGLAVTSASHNIPPLATDWVGVIATFNSFDGRQIFCVS